MSGSVVNPSHELRIYVKDADGWPLAGVNISLIVDGAAVGSVLEANGQALFQFSGTPHTLQVRASYRKLTKEVQLPANAEFFTLNFEEVHLMQDRLALYVGVGLWATALFLAFAFKNPSALQEILIRGTFALGCGGIGSVIPGMLKVQIGTGKRLAISAAGALAIFLLTFVAVPGKHPIF